MAIREFTTLAAEEWETRAVTPENILAFLKWFIANQTHPLLVKAAKQIKAVKATSLPSNPKALMGIDLKSYTLYVTPQTQWGDNTLDGIMAVGELKHELGHVIWNSLRTKPAAQAFVKAVLDESRLNKYISSYQEAVGKRFYAKRILQDVFIHESFAEWAKFGSGNPRGCPKQQAAFKKLFG